MTCLRDAQLFTNRIPAAGPKFERPAVTQQGVNCAGYQLLMRRQETSNTLY